MSLATWADPSSRWADPSSTWAAAGTTDLDFVCEWSPATDPGDSPVWVDITERVLSGRISRGRQSEFDSTSAGTLALTLDNRDGTFDPGVNANARPNKRIRVTVGAGADIRYLFDGWVDALPQSYRGPTDATVALTATDGFKLLSRFDLDAIYGGVVEADGPWGWWRLADDLPLVTSAADSSGNGFHAAIKGTPSSVGSLVSDGPGAMSFDGSGDNVEGSADGAVADASSGVTLAAAPLSIEAWVKTGKYGTNWSFICGQTHVVSSTAYIDDFSLVMNNQTGAASFVGQVGGGNFSLSGGSTMRDTGVHHVVGTVDGSRGCRLYVDGVLVAGPSTPSGSGLTVNSSGGFRIAKPPIAADPGAGSSYKAWKGEVCDVAIYDRALSGAEILEHYTAGSAPWSGDSTGARVARVLSLVGWPSGERSLDTGASTLGPARSIEGNSALDHLLAVEQTEQGRFFIDGRGRAVFRSRNYETALPTAAEFDDGENDGLEFEFSDDNLCNDCTVTRDGGTPQRAQDASSVDAYWRHSTSISGVLYSTDNEARAMAEWRVGNFSQPTMRPSALGFKPFINLPHFYPRVLARELGDRISVTKTTPAGATIDVDAVIEGITHTFNGGVHWQTSWNLSPLTFGQFGPGGGSGLSFLTLDDNTLGLLDGNNRLGF